MLQLHSLQPRCILSTMIISLAHQSHRCVFFLLVPRLHVLSLAVVEIYSIYFGYEIFKINVRNRPGDEEVEAHLHLHAAQRSSSPLCCDLVAGRRRDLELLRPQNGELTPLHLPSRAPVLKILLASAQEEQIVSM